MGTIVGALVVTTLMRIDPALNRVLERLLEGLSGTPRFMAIGGLGLAYCYVSSIPILVLHASRSLMPIERSRPKLTWIGKIWDSASPATYTGMVYIASVSYMLFALNFLHSDNLDEKIARTTFAVFVITTMAPFGAAFCLILFRKRSYRFYKHLAKSRARQGDSGELITSYRHLREHGNSIFIVSLEATLGLTLLSAYRASIGLQHKVTHLIYPPQFYLYGLIIAGWILPGVAVWFLATLIENEFLQDSMWP